MRFLCCALDCSCLLYTSLEVENASVLDEFYWPNKDDPNFSKNRATLRQGESANTRNRFNLSDEAAMELRLSLIHI